MTLFRESLGDALRERRLTQGMTLRALSAEASVSLGYISEIERGRKEASSELLASLCDALEVPLSAILRDVSDNIAADEARESVGRGVPSLPRAEGTGGAVVASAA